MTVGPAHQGRIWGATLLVAGSCIGGAMLGLPILTGPLGFFPSVALLIFSWAFMIATGLLLQEVNLWFGGEVSIVTMASKTLGGPGRYLAWTLFAFLFYSLLIAYMTGTGALITEVATAFLALPLPQWTGTCFCTALFGGLIFSGVSWVDRINRVFMALLGVSYCLLVTTGWHYVQPDHWSHRDWSHGFLVLPAMVSSYGFHNLIPSLTGYLKEDARGLKKALILGSLIPLALYVVWEALMLGIIPWEAMEKSGGADKAELATFLLRKEVGASWIAAVADSFAFSAMMTSFLGVALSFVDFLADGLQVEKSPKGRLFLTLAVLLPPLAVALSYPGAFLLAFRYAGSLGAAVIFGVMPAWMVWRGRYELGYEGVRLLPGGKPLLICVATVATGILLSIIF